MAAGLLFLVEAPLWAQAAGQGTAAQPASPASAAPSLFPEPEPKLVEKASLHGLRQALTAQDQATVTQMTWQLLAAMANAKAQGMGPSEFLAAGYRAEHLKGTDAAAVQSCLLSAWTGAQTLALFTPENMTAMEQGNAPRATRGPERGLFVNLELENLPAVSLTTKAPARKAVVAAEPLPVPEPVAMPATYVVKTLEVRLHERLPLDAYGLRNMDIRLDSINPNGSVSFLFEDRTARHTGYEPDDRVANLQRMSSRMGLSEGVGRMVNFTPVEIPDTKARGVKLLSQPFAAVYLDEDVGTQLNLHLIIRVNSEALNYDRLPPERQKLYQVRNP